MEFGTQLHRLQKGLGWLRKAVVAGEHADGFVAQRRWQAARGEHGRGRAPGGGAPANGRPVAFLPEGGGGFSKRGGGLPGGGEGGGERNFFFPPAEKTARAGEQSLGPRALAQGKRRTAQRRQRGLRGEAQLLASIRQHA